MMGKKLNLSQRQSLGSAHRFAKEAQGNRYGTEMLRRRRAGETFREIAVGMDLDGKTDLGLGMSTASVKFVLCGSDNNGDSYEGMMKPDEAEFYRKECMKRSGRRTAESLGHTLWSSGEKLFSHLCAKSAYEYKEISGLLKEAWGTERSPGIMKHNVFLYRKEYGNFKTALERARNSD